MNNKDKYNNLPDYHNPYIFNRNKLKAHFQAINYSSIADLENNNKNNIFSLSGSWLFNYYQNPDLVPANWFQFTEDFNKIQVPGVWELQGYGIPHYFAADFPKQISKRKNNIPKISSKDNPTGAYLRSFNLNADDNKRTFIKFEGIKSAFHLWINNQLVGYSQGSMTPSEFEITDYVIDGNNTVGVLVYRFSDGTYLEDQDMWFMSGIIRDVYIYQEPVIYIYDAYAQCELMNDYMDATLFLDVELSDSVEDYRISIDLIGRNIIPIRQKLPITKKISLSKDIYNPALWSSETPNLYQIRLSLFKDHQLIQVKQFNFGFRSVERKGHDVLINGKKLLIKGVNRHDFDPELAWGISKEKRFEDLKLIKQNNINAIRTSHYPNPTHLYEVCDQLGIYVMDEADIESHAVRDYLPGNMSEYEGACLQRIEDMVLRDRNYPSIIFWSLGNEAGFGKNFYLMKDKLLSYDSTRLVHYEGDPDHQVSDVVSMMYPTPQLEEQFGQLKDIVKENSKVVDFLVKVKDLKKEDYLNYPLLSCEYAHVLENSMGNLKEHLDNYEKYDNWLGGFIWDFVDQAIKVNDNGLVKWLYGGDFNDGKSSKHFCANGLVGADRKIHPAIQEVKKCYQYFDFKLNDKILTITNKYMFLDSSNFDFKISILISGVIVKSEPLLISKILPTNCIDIDLSNTLSNYLDSHDLILEVSASCAEDTDFCRKGYEVAFEQFQLTAYQPPILKTINNYDYFENIHDLVFKSEKYDAHISKKDGLVKAIIFNNINILKEPLDYNFTRATIDNELPLSVHLSNLKLFNTSFNNKKWGNINKSRKLISLEYSEKADCFEVVVTYKMNLLESLKTIYSFNNDGFNVENIVLPKKELIRFGMTLVVDNSFSKIKSYTRGPLENYCDRKSGAKLGIYSTNINQFEHNYMRPQENGNHCDTRFIELSNENKIIKISATSSQLLEVSAHYNSIEEIENSKHLYELPKTHNTYLNVDYGQRGVGGDIPGLLALQDHYKLPENKLYKYSFFIEFNNF